MKNIKVYSTNSCPWCVRAKEYLRDNNIEFEEKNVQLDRSAAMEMFKKTGQGGVPVIDIDGDIVIGFDKEMIDGLLGI